MTSFRRIVFTAPQQAQVEAIQADTTPAPDEALLRTEWSLISTGTELALYTGTNDLGRGAGDQYPCYPGYAAAGVVEAVGANVTHLAPGSRVLAASGHASHARFQPDRTVHLEIPAALSPEYAPFIRMALISLAALRQADIAAGEWLGVVGLGLVGNLGGQFGRCAGFRLIGVGRSALRSRIAGECGIESVLSSDAEHIARETKALTGGRGCRFVLETTGTAEGLQKAIALAGDGGTISLVGVPWREETGVTASAIMQPLFSRYLTLVGGWEWGIPLTERERGRPAPMIPNRHSAEANARYAAECILRGDVQIAPLITQRITPDEIQAAYQGLLHQRDQFMGVLIHWAGEDS